MQNTERFFNTSGPCNPKENYTLMRPDLMAKGVRLVERSRYFTIWAPRQTGKSTYFTLLCDELNKQDYIAIWISAEGFERDYTKERVLERLVDKVNLRLKKLGYEIDGARDIAEIIQKISLLPKKVFLVIDEIERFSKDYFDEFLHNIRDFYHIRSDHNLKSVLFVGVLNILGVIQDNSSPFNIADNLDIPYFTKKEVFELLGQHESKTNQKFDDQVKEKIFDITAGQPGLVNGFAYQLIENNQDKELLKLDEYFKVERFYLNKADDKNLENIKNKAIQYKSLLEKLLFKEKEIPFNIHKKSIKFLNTQGIIKESDNYNIEFWVPLYKKVLYEYLSPDFNGEGDHFFVNKNEEDFINKKQELDLSNLIDNFKDYVKARSFKHFMIRNEDGSYGRLKEASAGYAFSTYIEYYVTNMDGKIYYESNTGLGKTDMCINILNKEYVIEFKIFTSQSKFEEGKKQVSYYAKSKGLKEAHYMVFISTLYKQKKVKESRQNIDGVKVYTCVIWYDEDKDFG